MSALTRVAAFVAALLLTLTTHAQATVPSPWIDQDIGAVGAAGSATESGGTFTVKGAGADIWGTSDSFNYLYQPLSGDGQIVTRVVSLQNTNQFAKAAIMFRESLATNAREVTLDMKPGGGIEFLCRSITGASTFFAAGVSAAPGVWLKLVRHGSTVVAYTSPDGSAWNQLGIVSLSMPATIYVGLAVTSHATGVLTTAVFDNVTVGGDLPPAVSITSPAPGTSFNEGSNIALTANATDVDATPVARVDFYATNGSTTIPIGTAMASPFTVTWMNAPVGSWAISAIATDTAGLSMMAVDISIGVLSTSGTTLSPPWSNLDIGSVGAAGSASASGGVFTVNGAGGDIWGTADAFDYAYMPLSGDGEIVARVASLENTNQFAKAGIMFRESLAANAREVLLDMKPAGGIEFMARQSTGVSTSFLAGASAAPGVWLRLIRTGSTFTAYVSSDTAVWTILGSVTVVMGATAYVGLAVTSHVYGTLATAVFDAVSVGGSAAGTDVSPTVSITAPAAGTVFTAPANITITANAADSDATPVSRVDFYSWNPATGGTTFLGSATTSPYTFTWTNVPPGSYALKAVATDTAGLSATSALVSISVYGNNGTLPDPWVDLDVGNVGLAGSATYSSGTFTLKGAGADIWGTADSFNFAFQSQSVTTFQVVARVASLQNTNTYAKAGVMMREKLSTNPASVVLDVKPGGGIEFMARTTAGATTSFIAGGIGAAPIWLRLQRSGNVFYAFSSADGTLWTPIGSVTVPMGTTIETGLVVCSHNTGQLNTATFDHVSVGPF